MAKLKVQGNASGTGVVTLTAPNTNTDRTITLPDGDITLGVGIDDNATSTAITIDASEKSTFSGKVKVNNSDSLSWAPTSDAGVLVGSTSGSSLLVRTPSLNSSYNSGLAVYGSYDSGPATSHINITALSVYSGGPYTSELVFSTTAGPAIHERMRIDSAGIVTMPYQPAFYATGYTGQKTIPTTTTTLVLGSPAFNIGGHYNASNGRFTAPVTGIYKFDATVYWESSSSYKRMYLVKNSGSSMGYKILPASDPHTGQLSLLVDMNANDYIELKLNVTNSTNIYEWLYHTYLTGYLVS